MNYTRRIMLAKALFRTDPRVEAILSRLRDGTDEERLLNKAWAIETMLREECMVRAEVMAEWLGAAL